MPPQLPLIRICILEQSKSRTLLTVRTEFAVSSEVTLHRAHILYEGMVEVLQIQPDPMQRVWPIIVLGGAKILRFFEGACSQTPPPPRALPIAYAFYKEILTNVVCPC